MKLVYLASPLRGNYEDNIRKASEVQQQYDFIYLKEEAHRTTPTIQEGIEP